MKRALTLVAALVACVGAAPGPTTIRIWGQDTMRGVIQELATGYRRHRPEVAFELTLKGSATAIPGLYSDKADLALLARENDLVDDAGFGRVMQRKPLRLELMSGSLDRPGEADALVVLVRRDNPLERLTLTQLDAIASCERRRGGAPVQTWGDLGLKGEWRDKPIRIHMYDAETGSGIAFQHLVMKDSRKMPWDRVREYRNTRKLDGTLLTAAEQIATALRSDPHAIGIGSLKYAAPDLKAVALAMDASGPFVQPSARTIVSRTYPLARRTFAFADRKPGASLKPAVADFLRYVLSDEGQELIEKASDFLPLDQETRAQQRKILDEAR